MSRATTLIYFRWLAVIAAVVVVHDLSAQDHRTMVPIDPGRSQQTSVDHPGVLPRKVLTGVPRPEPEPELVLPSFVRFSDGQYALTQEFKFIFRDTRRIVEVPAGFVTDFSSIPSLAKPLFSSEQHDVPGLVHDFLYWRQSCTRVQADRLFERALAQLGVPKAKRSAMYLAVRLGGSSAWEANARERARALPRIIPTNHMRIPALPWKQYRERLHSTHHIMLDRRDRVRPAYCESQVQVERKS